MNEVWRRAALFAKQQLGAQTLTTERGRRAAGAGKFHVDKVLDVLDSGVHEGVGRTSKGVHDLGPVLDAPAATDGARDEY